MKILKIFLMSGILATACNNSNDTTQETPADMDDNSDNGKPNTQSSGRGTSNGYDDETDTLEEEIDHDHE